MEVFFKKIKTLALGSDAQRGTPFYSVRATQKWLGDLTGASGYDEHHTLVEGLARSNGDSRGVKVMQGTVTSITRWLKLKSQPRPNGPL